MITMIVIVLALSAVAVFYLAARSRRTQSSQIRPVDIKAFRTLMDRDDELFLREKLPHGRFSKVKRQRIRVTLRYVGRVSRNASTIIRLSEPARVSADVVVAQTAAQVMEMASQLRVQCLVASAKLWLEFAVPSLQLTPALLVPRYQALRDNVKRLGALQTRDASPVPVAI